MSSTYGERLAELTAAHERAEQYYGRDRDRWVTARTNAALTLLLDAAGVARSPEGVVLADGPGVDAVLAQQEVGPEEVRVVRWAAQTLDGPTVAAVAALLDRARTGRELDA